MKISVQMDKTRIHPDKPLDLQIAQLKISHVTKPSTLYWDVRQIKDCMVLLTVFLSLQADASIMNYDENPDVRK